MSDTMDRKRHVDVETLTPEQQDNLMKQLGDKMLRIVDEAVEKANKVLAVYGMESKMQLMIQEKTTKDEQI